LPERRMFAKTIIDSDAFLDMPISTQLLYFHLAMRADDDGFINNPKKIQRMIGCSDDDLKLLIAKRFIIPFESGIVVIKHWKIHNYIQKDRYKPTIYQDEYKRLKVKNSGGYSIMDTECIQDVSSLEAQVRLGKVSIGKERKDICGVNPQTQKFIPPIIDEIKTYCTERNNKVDPEKFHDFYTSKNWMIGKNKMKDWKAAVRTWEKENKQQQQSKMPQAGNFEQRQYSDKYFDDLYKEV
jgi:hypothetical protein